RVADLRHQAGQRPLCAHQRRLCRGASEGDPAARRGGPREAGTAIRRPTSDAGAAAGHPGGVPKRAPSTLSRDHQHGSRRRLRPHRLMQLAPGFEAFAAGYGAGKAALVWTSLVSDLETPVSAMLKLADGRPMSFLFESVEGGAARGRYS